MLKRTYKTLLRSCLKQKPSDNTKPLVQNRNYGHLQHTSSTPNLKRCWLCQSCNLLNNSVTWHCLNCDCVSFVAPIYKDTLQKSYQQPIYNDIKKIISDGSEQCKKNQLTESQSEVNGNKAKTIANAFNKPSCIFSMDTPNIIDEKIRKCQLCIINQEKTNTYLCQHQLNSKYIQFPLIDGKPTGDCYIKQPKYNVVTRYRTVDGLYNTNTNNNNTINKSLSNIRDALSGPINLSEGIFGEQILTIKCRPNNIGNRSSDALTQKRIFTDTHKEIQTFTQYAAEFAGQNVTNKNVTCNTCGMCNQTNCISNNNGEKCDKTDNKLSTSRVTITTLSRNRPTFDKLNNARNLTLSRKGGVLVSVGDWSNNNSPVTLVTPNSITDPSQEGYYEILKQGKINVVSLPYENVSTVAALEQESNNNNEQEENTAVYAVINKMNKSKNKKTHQQPQSYTPVIEPAKYSYIGLSSPITDAKHEKRTDKLDNIKKTNSSSVMNKNMMINLINDNDTNCSDQLSNVIVTPQKECRDTQITITAGVNSPNAETSEIYAKVWKESRKPVDSQKMLVCCKHFIDDN